MSINANELRIGNYINHSNSDYWIDSAKGTPIKIEIDQLIEIDTGSEDRYEPIPLTPEILEQCGFKDRGVRRIGSNEPIEWRLDYATIIKNGDDFEYVLHTNEWGFEAEKVTIKYLHQLQNLHFALTGEELSIQLTTKQTQ